MNEIVYFTNLLRPSEDSLIELRILTKGGGVLHGYYDDPERLATDATAYNGHGNAYVTLNEVHPDCRHRVYNRVQKAGRNATKDHDIIRRSALLIDLDPQRLSGIPSSNAEHEAALERARQVREYLGSLGWPDPILTDSGNGAGLLYRIDLSVDDGKLVQHMLKKLDAQFSDSDVKIDTSVHNASRITRLCGSKNLKGEHTAERPHRMARVVEAPEKLQCVTREQLESMCGSTVQKPSVGSGSFHVGTWLDGLGVEYTARRDRLGELDGTWYTLRYCPAKGPEHTDGNTGIFQSDDGRTIRAKCHHAKCSDLTWKKLRPLLDEQFDDRADATAVGSATEGVRDPHRLARIIYDEFEHPERRTMMLVDGVIYTWNGRVWDCRTDPEIKRHICRSVKDEFDRYAEMREQLGAPVTTPQVRNALVGDVFGALTSMIEVRTSIGGWIDGNGPPVDQLIVCRNGIVDLQAFADGREDYLIPHTPRLFVLNGRDFDFVPSAPEPKRWMDFLNELWPNDSESQELLQDFFGYSLTDDVRFQKFLLMFGPTRGGKGTIARLLTRLIGKENTCAIRLGNITQRFALENVIGKSLILIPDAKMPRADRLSGIVELLKAIVGGDLIDVDRKYSRAVSLTLPVKIVITSNDVIALPDESDALYERMLVLRFENTFKDKPDPDLDAKLRAELPGILLWAVQGWKRLRERGRFIEPESGSEAKTTLQESANPIRVFLQECCIIDPSLRAGKDELYQVWDEWCRAGGHQTTGKEQFGKLLLSAVPTIKSRKFRAEGGRLPCYQGLALRCEEDRNGSDVSALECSAAATEHD